MLKLSTLNTRVSLTRITPQTFSGKDPSSITESDFDIEASRRGLLDESTTSHLTMNSAGHDHGHKAYGSTLVPTGDATEVGIYK